DGGKSEVEPRAPRVGVARTPNTWVTAPRLAAGARECASCRTGRRSHAHDRHDSFSRPQSALPHAPPHVPLSQRRAETTLGRSSKSCERPALLSCHPCSSSRDNSNESDRTRAIDNPLTWGSTCGTGG